MTAERCRGGSEWTNCACGYEGPLCSECSEEHFATWAGDVGGHCKKCSAPKAHIPSIVLGAVVLLCLLLVLGRLKCLKRKTAHSAKDEPGGSVEMQEVGGDSQASGTKPEQDIAQPVGDVSPSDETQHALGATFARWVSKAGRLKEICRAKAMMIFYSFQVVSKFVSIAENTGEGKGFPEVRRREVANAKLTTPFKHFPPVTDALAQPAATLAAGLGVANLDVLSFVPLSCGFPTDFYSILLIKSLGTLVPVGMLGIYPMTLRIRGKPYDDASQFAKRIALIWLEIVLPSVSVTIASAFVCEEFEHGFFLRAQLTLACDGSDRRMAWVYLASLMTLLYPIGESKRNK